MPSDSHLTLYMRPGCHLCTEATSLLRRLGLTVDEVDIDLSPDLRLQYDERVPVLAVDGREVLAGIIREDQVRLALTSSDRDRPWLPNGPP